MDQTSTCKANRGIQSCTSPPSSGMRRWWRTCWIAARNPTLWAAIKKLLPCCRKHLVQILKSLLPMQTAARFHPAAAAPSCCPTRATVGRGGGSIFSQHSEHPEIEKKQAFFFGASFFCPPPFFEVRIHPNTVQASQHVTTPLYNIQKYRRDLQHTKNDVFFFVCWVFQGPSDIFCFFVFWVFQGAGRWCYQKK